MKARGFLLAATAIVSLAAVSQSNAHNRGWYVGIESGATWIDDNSVIFAQPDYSDVSIAADTSLSSWWGGNSGSIDFDTGWAGLATVGYGFEKNWRVELEVGYRDNDATLTRNGACEYEYEYCYGSRSYEGDFTEWTAMVNVIYDVPLTERLDLNIGLGAGVDFVHLDVATGGRAIDRIDDSDTRFAFQAIAGLTYAVSKRLDLTLTYRYLNVSEPAFEGRYQRVELDDVEKHTVTVGLRYDLYGDEEPAAPLPPVAPPVPPSAPKQFIIYFGFNKCNISAEADAVLSDAAATAKSTGSASIVVVGHTDSVGSNAYNQRLSECRANAAKSNLVNKGIPGSAIQSSGRGETELTVKTGDGVKEPQNRRTEINLN